MKFKTINLLEGNTAENHSGPKFCDFFKAQNKKAGSMKEKVISWTLLKLVWSALWNTMPTEWKYKPTTGRKIFLKHISDKVLVAKICKKINHKKI